MNLPKIKVKGLTGHAKNRIGTYSEDGIFLIKRDLRTETGEQKVLLESTKPNFKIGKDKKIPWGGWFEIGTEIEIVEEETSTE